MSNEEVIVTVCIITYNHIKYAQKAIESVLSQIIQYKMEIVIADDYSTDGTRELLIDYQKRYPSLIKLILQNENVGAIKNWMDLIAYPKSKYIAYFEGDDYWLDKHKLQKQISFLEQNEDYYLTAGTTLIEINGLLKKRNWRGNKFKQTNFSVVDYIENTFFHTSSACFRRSPFFPTARIPEFLQGDIYLYLFMSQPNSNKIKFFDEEFSCYRIHENGITKASTNKNPKIALTSLIELYSYFNDYTHGQYSKFILNKISRVELALIASQKSKINKIVVLIKNYRIASKIILGKLNNIYSNFLFNKRIR